MEHEEKESKLEAVMLVSLFREMALHDSNNIQISDSNSIVKHKENEEGLCDRQKGEDIVHSVSSTAKYRDRQYGTVDGFSSCVSRRN